MCKNVENIQRKGISMKFTGEIFERATIRGVADYLLYGLTVEKENRDYETRLNESYLKYEKNVFKYDKNETSELIDLANAMTSETASVYMEIGLQAGILLMKDLIQNLEICGQERKGKADYQDMYDFLFKDVSSALTILHESADNNARKASEILKQGQCRAEEIYMESETTSEVKR